MSSNGTLTYFDEQNNIFKTVSIHHIENNYSNDIDSLEILNKYFKKPEKAKKLIEKGFLSYFNKEEIIKGSDEIALISNSIEELKKLTLSWTSYNYVYFLDHWYPNPIDVENIYYKFFYIK